MNLGKKQLVKSGLQPAGMATGTGRYVALNQSVRRIAIDIHNLKDAKTDLGASQKRMKDARAALSEAQKAGDNIEQAQKAAEQDIVNRGYGDKDTGKLNSDGQKMYDSMEDRIGKKESPFQKALNNNRMDQSNASDNTNQRLKDLGQDAPSRESAPFPSLGDPDKTILDSGLAKAYNEGKKAMDSSGESMSPIEKNQLPAAPPENPNDYPIDDQEKAPSEGGDNLGARQPEEGDQAKKEKSDKVDPDKQGKKASELKKAKEKGQKAKETANKAKEAAERAKKAAETVKKVKQVKNIKQFLMLFKVTAGITIEGLILTYLTMLGQFLLGNLLKIVIVPRLGRYEKLIFMFVTLVVIVGLFTQMLMILGPFLAPFFPEETLSVLGSLIGG